MKLTVLGCHGGESPTHRMTTFLIDDDISIDAGSLCRGLDLDQQYKIAHVIISHTHLDHISDLAFLADNVIGMRPDPVTLHCTEKTVETLQNHFFNNKIWPDFTRIKIPKSDLPVLQYSVYKPGVDFKVGRYMVRATPVNHPVESMAMIFKWNEGGRTGAIGYSSDTGPTDAFWAEIAQQKDLKALLCECSFPLELQWLADVSGHLSPKTMHETIQKAQLGANVPILLYHGKPSHLQVLKNEVRALGDERMTMLKPNDRFEFT
ncbi:MAG: 3',5'-cyclic-nucleotide phosphodiesterase [Deltaproteobacteria bacterium]|nr:3',5'-cyclic-nucleotide phosphodiesterase [Deltaproteobacteria bacterium]